VVPEPDDHLGGGDGQPGRAGGLLELGADVGGHRGAGGSDADDGGGRGVRVHRRDELLVAVHGGGGGAAGVGEPVRDGAADPRRDPEQRGRDPVADGQDGDGRAAERAQRAAGGGVPGPGGGGDLAGADQR